MALQEVVKEMTRRKEAVQQLTRLRPKLGRNMRAKYSAGESATRIAFALFDLKLIRKSAAAGITSVIFASQYTANLAVRFSNIVFRFIVSQHLNGIVQDPAYQMPS